MEENSTTADTDGRTLFAGDAWFDPIETGIRDRVRGFIEELLEQELTAALGGRSKHERAVEHHQGSGTREWCSEVLPRYARRTRQVEALIASAYLAGTNTRRVKRALAPRFKGAVGKDVVSRAWRKVSTDWTAWLRRDLAAEDFVRLILDGTVVRVRLDRKATRISLLVVLGVRRDGQKVLLSIKNMGGESEAGWRGVLDDLVARGLRTPEFLMVDGGAGLDRALAGLWPDVPVQRCTVHKHRNLLAHAPDALHDEVSADYTDMIYAATAAEVQQRRRGVPAQMAAALSGGGDQPGGSRRTPVQLPPAAPVAVEIGADHQCHRAAPRGVQAPDQDADGATIGRDRSDAILGVVGVGTDHDA